VISRVAEHCFWLARYLERADNTARILDVNQTLLLDYQVPLEKQWLPVLIISGIHDYKGSPESEVIQEFMTWDEANPCSIATSLGWARENARIIREVISAEMWERLNHWHLWLRSERGRELYQQNRSDFYHQIKRINQLLHGICDDTMSHGEPWEFMQFGKNLERACQTARILDVKYHMAHDPLNSDAPIDNAHWMAILTTCSGYEPFHKKLRAPVDPAEAVAEFLVLDAEFPRSVLCCLVACQQSIQAITKPYPHINNSLVRQRMDALSDWLHNSTIDDLMKLGLHQALTRVVDEIHGIGEAVYSTFFDFKAQIPEVTTSRKMVQTMVTTNS
jgi:uncharacterized alpha-E superfamily protein